MENSIFDVTNRLEVGSGWGRIQDALKLIKLSKTVDSEIISNPIEVYSGRGRILDNQIKLGSVACPVIQAGDQAHNIEL